MWSSLPGPNQAPELLTVCLTAHSVAAVLVRSSQGAQASLQKEALIIVS